MSETSSNKKIAKNTVYLYFRMLFVMAVSIYSSRIVLNVLGAGDYGLYNVVGGVVAMLSFLNGAAGSATSRYLAFYLGKNDLNNYQQSFSAAFFIHLGIAVVILIFAETFGLWFLFNKMIIDPERMEAAVWVFQLSVLSCFITFTQVPYNASIIAHERMSVYSYIGILEAVLKLFVLYMLSISPYDKLKTWSFLLFLLSLLIALIYRFYCKIKFKECTLCWVKDKKLFRELFNYSGWNTLGSITGIAQTQGINVVLNMFFSTIVNAARGVAYQVDAAVMSFISNFLTAVTPQVVKAYASKNIDRMCKLLLIAGKYALLLFSCMAIPLILEASYVLELWLKNPPEYSVVFLQLVLANHFISLLNQIINIGVHATGDVKRLNIYAGTISILKLPLAYVILLFGCGPVWVFVSIIPMTLICLFADIRFLKMNIRFDHKEFLSTVFVKDGLLILLPLMLSLLVVYRLDEGFFRLVIVILTYCISLFVIVYTFGLSKSERLKVNNALIKIIKRNV